MGTAKHRIPVFPHRRARPLRAFRRLAGDGWRAFGDALAGRVRPLPAFIVAGGMRCGTTSLYEHLAGHPQVAASLRKEVHFFDLQHHRGPGWYARQFHTVRRLPDGSSSRPFESSPYYMFDPRVPVRLREMVPDVRLVFVLRDPVERAVSHYRKNRRDGREPLSFADAIDAEEERLAGEEERMLNDPRYLSPAHQYFSYQSRGRYAQMLDRFRALFPADQLHAVDAGRLFAEPIPVFERICRFLELDPWLPTRFAAANASHTDAMVDAATRRRLEVEFDPHERSLMATIGWRPSSWQTSAEAA